MLYLYKNTGRHRDWQEVSRVGRFSTSQDLLGARECVPVGRTRPPCVACALYTGQA